VQASHFNLGGMNFFSPFRAAPLSPHFSPFRTAPLSPHFSPFRAAPLSPHLGWTGHGETPP
jgi:hypothetical protein